MKKQKGITLIALIITTIVMIILVGVTINVAVNSGLFEKSREGKIKTEIAEIQEQLVAKKTELLANNNGNPISSYNISLASLGLSEALTNRYQGKLVIGTDGILYYIEEAVTDEEKIYFEEMGITPQPTQPVLTGKKYYVNDKETVIVIDYDNSVLEAYEGDPLDLQGSTDFLVGTEDFIAHYHNGTQTQINGGIGLYINSVEPDNLFIYIVGTKLYAGELDSDKGYFVFNTDDSSELDDDFDTTRLPVDNILVGKTFDMYGWNPSISGSGYSFKFFDNENGALLSGGEEVSGLTYTFDPTTNEVIIDIPEQGSLSYTLYVIENNNTIVNMALVDARGFVSATTTQASGMLMPTGTVLKDSSNNSLTFTENNGYGIMHYADVEQMDQSYCILLDLNKGSYSDSSLFTFTMDQNGECTSVTRKISGTDRTFTKQQS